MADNMGQFKNNVTHLEGRKVEGSVVLTTHRLAVVYLCIIFVSMQSTFALPG